jgi:hypothetical protein
MSQSRFLIANNSNTSSITAEHRDLLDNIELINGKIHFSDVKITNSLEVEGTNTVLNSTTVALDDPLIVVGSGMTSSVIGGISVEHDGKYSGLLRTTGDTFVLTKNTTLENDITPLNSLAVSDLSTASHGSVDSILTTLSTLATIKILGGWDASGSPNSNPAIGNAYIVTTGGTHSVTSQLGTFNSWSVGDWIVNTQFGWSKVDNTIAVGLDLFQLCPNSGVLVTNEICEILGTGMISVQKQTAYNKNFGTTAGTILEGDAIDFKATLNLQENNINLNTLASSSVVNIHTMIIVGNTLFVSSGVANSGVDAGLYVFDITGSPKFLTKIEGNTDLDKSFIAVKIGKFLYNANANSNNTGSANTYIDVSNPSSPVILNSSGTKVAAPPVSMLVQYAQNVVGAKYDNSVSVYPLDTLDRVSTELKNYVLSPAPSTGNAIQDLRTDGTSIIVFTSQFLSSSNPTENHVWIIDMVAETITRQAITATDGHNTIWDYNGSIKGQSIAQDGSIFYTIGRGGNNSSVLNVSRNDFSDKTAIIQTHLKSTSSNTATAYSFGTHFPRICVVAGRLYICRSDGVIEILDKDTLAFVAEITPSFVATTMVVRANKLIIGGANLIAIYDIGAFSPDNISTNLILAKELSIVNNCSIGNQLDVGSLGVSKGLFVSGSALIDDTCTTDSLFVTDVSSRVTAGTININDSVELKGDLSVTGAIVVQDPLILIGESNAADAANLGVLFESVDASTTQPVYHGLIRKLATPDFYLVRDATSLPTPTVDPNTLSKANLYSQNLHCSNVFAETIRGPSGSANLQMGSLSAFSGNVTMSADCGIAGELVVTDSSAFNSNLIVGGDLTVTGDVIINGSTISMNVTEVDVEDTILLLGKDNPADLLNLGILFESVDASTTNSQWSGLLRKPSTSEFYLINDATTKPTTSIDPTAYSLSSLSALNLTCTHVNAERYKGPSGTANLEISSSSSDFTGDVTVSGSLQVGTVNQDSTVDSFSCVSFKVPTNVSVNLTGDKELVAVSGCIATSHNMVTNVIVGSEISFTIPVDGMYELSYNINADVSVDSTFTSIGFILNGSQTGSLWVESSTVGRRMTATAMTNAYQNFSLIRALDAGDVVKPRIAVTGAGNAGLDMRNYSFSLKKLRQNI